LGPPIFLKRAGEGPNQKSVLSRTRTTEGGRVKLKGNGGGRRINRGKAKEGGWCEAEEDRTKTEFKQDEKAG